MAAQGLVFPSLMWETQIQPQAPDLQPAQSWLLLASGRRELKDGRSLSLLLSFPNQLISQP